MVLKKTKRNIVLQIDDDLKISRKCVQILYKTLKVKEKAMSSVQI